MEEKPPPDAYVRALQANSEQTRAYYRSSLRKTEQQKFLEGLLAQSGRTFEQIADIACGGGTLSFHLRALYPEATFTLVDFNAEALEMAAEVNAGGRCRFVCGDIYGLERLASDSFDLVCCWQTLSWLDRPEDALRELVRIARPGGKLFLSSLFNLRHDVDIYARVVDHTRPGAEMDISFAYNTYSSRTVGRWLAGLVKSHAFREFLPTIDFTNEGRGIGTYTVRTSDGLRLQISAGYLMNWAVLEIDK